MNSGDKTGNVDWTMYLFIFPELRRELRIVVGSNSNLIRREMKERLDIQYTTVHFYCMHLVKYNNWIFIQLVQGIISGELNPGDKTRYVDKNYVLLYSPRTKRNPNLNIIVTCNENLILYNNCFKCV